MSEVGTPSPHNSDKPHGLVDSINNNNNNNNNIIHTSLVVFYRPTSERDLLTTQASPVLVPE